MLSKVFSQSKSQTEALDISPPQFNQIYGKSGKWTLMFGLCNCDMKDKYYCVFFGGLPFSMYVKFYQKLTFLTP